MLSNERMPMSSHVAAAGAEKRTRSSSRIAGRFCVFVSSSDRARDIFEIVFKNAETMWRDCDWPRYVGFTSPHPDMYGFTAVAAKQKSNWQGELSDQLDQLPASIEYVFLTFEDALFTKPIDGAALNEIAELMVRDDISYVSLVPVSRNIPGLIVEYFRRKRSTYPLRPLADSEPYYSSVFSVIWKRSHLQDLLHRQGSIWDFEHIVTKERHYATWKTILFQDQVVSRGKWDRDAARQLAKQGLSLGDSKREVRRLTSYLRDIREKIVFQFIGFLSFRVRRRLKMISHRLGE
jgi:hypothetical protein